jgi:hypothetical protein
LSDRQRNYEEELEAFGFDVWNGEAGPASHFSCVHTIMRGAFVVRRPPETQPDQIRFEGTTPDCFDQSRGAETKGIDALAKSPLTRRFVVYYYSAVYTVRTAHYCTAMVAVLDDFPLMFNTTGTAFPRLTPAGTRALI